MEPTDKYRSDLEKTLQAAQKRVRLGVAAKTIKDNATDFFAIIDEEITILAGEILADKPLSYEDYLNKHGRVQGLKRTRQMAEYREKDHVNASEEVKTIRGQLKDLDKQAA